MGYQAALDKPGTESDVETLTDFISGRDKDPTRDEDFNKKIMYKA